MKISTNYKEFKASFNKDIKNWQHLKIHVISTLGLDGVAGLQIMSPVKTGRFRASHFLSVDNPKFEYINYDLSNMEYEAIRIQKLAQAKEDLSRIDLNKKGTITIYITNNVDYAQLIESGAYSTKPGAPSHLYERMVDILDARADQIILSLTSFIKVTKWEK